MRLIYCLIMALAVSMSAGAQKLPNDSSEVVFPEQEALRKAVQSTHVITSGETSDARRDSIEQLIASFYVDQYRHFQDPRAPYFMFLSKDSKLAMGVGGVVRMRGWYDWDGGIPANGFVPYLIPIPKDPTNMKRLAATPAGCAVFLTILGRKTPIGNFMGFIQGGFDGYNNINFKLKKAYVIVNDWTVGYATSTFVDPATQPPTIDGAGPNGFTSKTQVLVRYFHTIKDKWSIGGGVEIPSSTLATDDSLTKKCSEYIPDIAALGQYQWDQGLSHVRLSALLHFSSYRDIAAGRNYTVPGYGLQLSLVTKIVPRVTAYGHLVWGKGIGSYLSDLSVDRYDLVPDPERQDRMYAPNSIGYTLGAKFFFTPSIYASACWGQLRYLPEQNPKDASYKYGQYLAANLFWDMSARFQVGIEYLHGRRMNFDHTNGSANRVDALFQFSF